MGLKASHFQKQRDELLDRHGIDLDQLAIDELRRRNKRPEIWSAPLPSSDPSVVYLPDGETEPVESTRAETVHLGESVGERPGQILVLGDTTLGPLFIHLRKGADARWVRCTVADYPTSIGLLVVPPGSVVDICQPTNCQQVKAGLHVIGSFDVVD